MVSIYYCSVLERIVLLSVLDDVIIWDYGLDRKYKMSKSQSIYALSSPLYNYQLIGVFNEN
jgi:hypothetical protein